MNSAVATSPFPVMGTIAEVRIIGAAELIRYARSRLEELERLWSRFLPDSEISILNRSGGVPTVVSGETFTLISQAIDAWALTNGSFDPTIGAAMAACGYDRPMVEMDPTAPVDPAGYRSAPGPSAIVLHRYANAIEVPDGIAIDLGGIAKGAAADLVSAELIAAGADGCLVNIGGDIALAGIAPRSEGWQITLDCPGAHRTIDVGVRTGAICTSTKTKRTWGAGSTSKPEHHLRNPRSGAPIETGLASVTVIAERAIQAEVLTKAVFAIGVGAGCALVENAGATGLIVDDDEIVRPMAGLDVFRAAALTAEPV